MFSENYMKVITKKLKPGISFKKFPADIVSNQKLFYKISFDFLCKISRFICVSLKFDRL